MAEAMKRFVNQTGKEVTVTLFIRSGDSPMDEGGTEAYDLDKGADAEIVYEGDPGSLGYVYLNGLLVEWEEGSDYVGVSRRVKDRGDAWDDLLNTNDAVTLEGTTAGTLQATGSN